MSKVLLRIILPFALAVGFAGQVLAQPKAEAGGWQYELTPYLWAAGMKGDVRVGTLPTVSPDVSFSDILDVLDFGLMGTFEARKGRWGFLLDGIYMKLSTSAVATRTGPGPVGATLTANANLKMEQTMLAGAAVYRAVEGRTPVDVIGGLRYNKVDMSADVNASIFGLGTHTISGAISGDKDWVDPFIGVRVQHPIADRWTLLGYGDIGGFGAGSDFTWQVGVGVGYEFSKSLTGKLGYRFIAVDYDKKGFVYDMDIYGIYLGVGIRF
jgi:opacity protein-like surface antigen